MPPYWRRNGAQGPDLVAAALQEQAQLRQSCDEFDFTLEVLALGVCGVAWCAYREYPSPALNYTFYDSNS